MIITEDRNFKLLKQEMDHISFFVLFAAQKWFTFAVYW